MVRLGHRVRSWAGLEGVALPADRLHLAIAVVMVVLPFGTWQVPGLGMSLVFVAMIPATGLALRRLVIGHDRVPDSFVLLGLGLSLISGVVSMAGADDPSTSVHLLIPSALSLGYALAIGLCFAEAPDLAHAAIPLLVLVAGGVAAYALSSIGSLKSADGGSVVNGRLLGPFEQPNELGMFCAAMLPIAVAAISTARTHRSLFVMSVCALAIACAWAMSMSRGAWIGGVAALVVLAACEPTTRRTLGAVAAVVGAACVTAFLVPSSTPVLGIIGARIHSLGDPSQNPYDARPAIWTEAWRQAGERPWVGAGPGGYTDVASASISTVSADPPAHAHDIYLTILAERGVLGLGLGVVLVAGIVVAAYRHIVLAPAFGMDAAQLRTVAVAVVASLAAIGAHGFFDMPLRNPIVSSLVWTLLGFAVAAETAPSVEEARWRSLTSRSMQFPMRAGVF